jgi:phosphatidylserine/phosphatidylglycerophosphate/cardiolipin synthase-like enzyme
VSGDLRSQMQAVEPLISRIGLLPDSLKERSVLYALVGSMNKDARSMMLDGETLLAVSGRWGLVHYLDFALLAGRTTWLHDRAQLDELLPPYSTFDRWLGRLLRDLF